MEDDSLDAVLASFDEYVQSSELMISMLRAQIALQKEAIEVLERMIGIRHEIKADNIIKFVRKTDRHDA